MNILKVKEISKLYGKNLVLDNVSINVPRGEILGLLGPNGAGKTTLIRIINQIINSDNGKLFFNDKEMRREDIANIGYLPEERGLYAKMKVGEHLLYMAQLKGFSGNKAKNTIEKFLDEFEIGGWWNKKVEQLSKGMQQKLQFIIAIMHSPDLVILDEPFTGFDPINIEIIKKRIVSMKEKGVTFILSTHRMESVEELCENIVLINESKKILDGKKFDIKEKYKQNVFEIVFEKTSQLKVEKKSELFELLSVNETNGRSSMQIRLNGNVTINDILKELLTDINIYSVNEIIPSINDIFISMVNKKENNNE